ncbi:MAG TPA: hypothetical protein VF190_07785 [Rhodothermales bacterium]
MIETEAHPTEAAPTEWHRASIALQRLAAALREQNWVAVVLEFGIVVMGVVIGFQVTAWGNERAARSEEEALLNGLRVEFSEVLVGLDQQAAKHLQISRDVTRILETLRQAERSGGAFATIADTTLAWALVPTTTQFSQGVLSGMLSTGRLELVRDLELRTALAEWAGVLADVTEDEVASRQIVMNQLEPLLWRLMDARPIRSYELLLGTLPPSTMQGTSDVPVNTELMGALSTRLFWQNHTIREFEAPQAEARRILSLIDRSLQ